MNFSSGVLHGNEEQETKEKQRLGMHIALCHHIVFLMQPHLDKLLRGDRDAELVILRALKELFPLS
jgi:hypothetical protein